VAVPATATVVALGALVPRWRATTRQVLALGAVALVGGWALLQLPALWHAIVPNQLTEPAVRAGLGLVVGLVVGAAVVAVRPPRRSTPG
jgi:prepilin signal peptidase PulO-like enzyme (type II secretory pathway)